MTRPTPSTTRLLIFIFNICFILFVVLVAHGSSTLPLMDDVKLPLNQTTIKIEISETGIYELSYADLAGLTGGVKIDPSSFQMMHNFAPVATQFIGDGDDIFEPNEAIRFFAEEYTGNQFGERYSTNQFYWLWWDGAALEIDSAGNQMNNQVISHIPISTVFDEKNVVHLEGAVPDLSHPDIWFWRSIRIGVPTTIDLTIPNISQSDNNVSFEVEILNQHSLDEIEFVTELNAIIRDSLRITEDEQSISIHFDVSASTITSDRLSFNFEATRLDGTLTTQTLLLNDITVTYEGVTKAVQDELIFEYSRPLESHFLIEDLSVSNSAELIVWDISNPNQPVEIEIEADDYVDGVLHFGRTTHPTFKALVTTEANVKQPLEISTYTPTQGFDAVQTADWLVISYGDFIDELQPLIEYRQDQGLVPFVVDVEDIINQFGAGAPTPDAIRAFLQHAHAEWPHPNKYVLLVGAYSYNAAQRPCENCNNWDDNPALLVPTDLIATDRFMGLIPSDFSLSLLEGGDLIPEVMIGRIPAETEEQVDTVVANILRYEQAVRAFDAYQENWLFIADDDDAGGQFCAMGEELVSLAPGDVSAETLCLDAYIDANDDDSTIAKEHLRQDMIDTINAGVGVVSFSGHGAIDNWAGDLFNTENVESLNHQRQPFVLLNGSRLSNNFVFPNVDSLGATFLMESTTGGAAASWGHSGLNFSFEEQVLSTGFLTSLAANPGGTIGELVREAQIYYTTTDTHQPLLYNNVFLGDPAMQFYVPDYPNRVYLPIATK